MRQTDVPLAQRFRSRGAQVDSLVNLDVTPFRADGSVKVLVEV